MGLESRNGTQAQSRTFTSHKEGLDSFVLHGPSTRGPLDIGDWEAWAAIESLVDQRKVRLIGVSNISFHQLKEIIGRARIKPSFVQNRCFAVRMGFCIRVSRC